MSREENIKIFENTASMYHYDKELAESIVQQNNYTQVIPEGKEIKYVRPSGEDLESMKVVVTQSKTQRIISFHVSL